MSTNSSGILGWDAQEAKAATAMQAQVRGSQVRSHMLAQAGKDVGTRQESAQKPSADMESSLQRDHSSPPLCGPSHRPQSPPAGQQSPRIPRSSPPPQPLSEQRSPTPPEQLERHSTPLGEVWTSPSKALEPLRSPVSPHQTPLRSQAPPHQTPLRGLAPPHQTPQRSAPTRRSAGVDGWGVAEQSDMRVQANRSTVRLVTGSPVR